MDGSRPAPTARLLCRKADKVQEVLVEEVGAAVWTRRPGQCRNRVDYEGEIAFTPSDGILGAFQIVNVRQQHTPANDVAVRVTNRKATIREPAIDAIGPSKALHDFVRCAGRERTREYFDDVRPILRMNCVVRPPLPELFERLAEVLEHLAVDDFDVTGRGQECDQPRDAVHEQARTALAFAQCFTQPRHFLSGRLACGLFRHGPAPSVRFTPLRIAQGSAIATRLGCRSVQFGQYLRLRW